MANHLEARQKLEDAMRQVLFNERTVPDTYAPDERGILYGFLDTDVLEAIINERYDVTLPSGDYALFYWEVDENQHYVSGSARLSPNIWRASMISRSGRSLDNDVVLQSLRPSAWEEACTHLDLQFLKDPAGDLFAIARAFWEGSEPTPAFGEVCYVPVGYQLLEDPAAYEKLRQSFLRLESGRASQEGLRTLAYGLEDVKILSPAEKAALEAPKNAPLVAFVGQSLLDEKSIYLSLLTPNAEADVAERLALEPYDAGYFLKGALAQMVYLQATYLARYENESDFAQKAFLNGVLRDKTLTRFLLYSDEKELALDLCRTQDTLQSLSFKDPLRTVVTNGLYFDREAAKLMDEDAWALLTYNGDEPEKSEKALEQVLNKAARSDYADARMRFLTAVDKAENARDMLQKAYELAKERDEATAYYEKRRLDLKDELAQAEAGLLQTAESDNHLHAQHAWAKKNVEAKATERDAAKNAWTKAKTVRYESAQRLNELEAELAEAQPNLWERLLKKADQKLLDSLEAEIEQIKDRLPDLVANETALSVAYELAEQDYTAAQRELILKEQDLARAEDGKTAMNNGISLVQEALKALPQEEKETLDRLHQALRQYPTLFQKPLKETTVFLTEGYSDLAQQVFVEALNLRRAALAALPISFINAAKEPDSLAYQEARKLLYPLFVGVPADDDMMFALALVTRADTDTILFSEHTLILEKGEDHV